MDIREPQYSGDEGTYKAYRNKKYKVGDVNAPGDIVPHGGDYQSVLQLKEIGVGAYRAEQQED
jgi:hypothetical protein